MIDSYNVNACCQKLYTTWSSGRASKKVEKELKNSHMMIRALQLRRARQMDREFVVDDKIIPFMGENEMFFLRSLRKSKIDKSIVTQIRQKRVSGKEVKKIYNTLSDMYDNGNYSYDLKMTMYDAKFMLNMLDGMIAGRDKEEEAEDIPFS